MIKKIRSNLSPRKLLNRFAVDSGDWRQTIFLAGTGRSGTTWVEETLNSRNDCRIMFEPFHSKKVAILRDWNYRQYIRHDARRDTFLKPASAIYVVYRKFCPSQTI